MICQNMILAIIGKSSIHIKKTVLLIAHVLNVNQAKLGEYGHLARLYVCNNPECVCWPIVLFLREVNLDQNIVLTGADEFR